MEKRADNLFAQLETIRGILDRIAQSQTDKLVSAGRFITMLFLVMSSLERPGVSLHDGFNVQQLTVAVLLSAYATA